MCWFPPLTPKASPPFVQSSVKSTQTPCYKCCVLRANDATTDITLNMVPDPKWLLVGAFLLAAVLGLRRAFWGRPRRGLLDMPKAGGRPDALNATHSPATIA